MSNKIEKHLLLNENQKKKLTLLLENNYGWNVLGREQQNEAKAFLERQSRNDLWIKYYTNVLQEVMYPLIKILKVLEKSTIIQVYWMFSFSLKLLLINQLVFM